jgi:hypothetical protein
VGKSSSFERRPAKGRRPSFGRSKAERGLDQFDTPPIALAPLFVHEPLLAGVKSVCEPFCGKGNLVIAMRARGLTVFASDIQDRSCPDSVVLDFLKMTSRPPGCDVLLSNPPYGEAMAYLEHAWALGFRLVVLLLPPSFLFTAGRFERMHKRGHLRRVHTLAERLQDMHDANFTGEKASQSQVHAWFVFDRNYYGKAEINAVSIHRPTERMPWSSGAVCQQCRKPYQPQRTSSRFCSPTCRQRAHYRRLSVRISVRTGSAPNTAIEPTGSSEVFRYVRHADVPRFTAEGWELLPALDGTHHGEYGALMRRRKNDFETGQPPAI